MTEIVHEEAGIVRADVRDTAVRAQEHECGGAMRFGERAKSFDEDRVRREKNRMFRALSAIAVCMFGSMYFAGSAYAQVPNRFSVSDPAIAEGNSGSTNMAFVVSLDRSSCNTTCTVNWATSAGSATAGTDFTSASGVLTFVPPAVACFDQAQTVNVPIVGDTTSENFETVNVVLSNVTGNGCDIFDATGTGTLQNDDLVLSIADASGPETGFAAPPMVIFTVSPLHISVTTASFNYATSNGTAIAAADYTAGSGVITFPANFQSFTIVVPVLSDTLDEADETFTMTLSAPQGATFSDAVATGTILDDDPTPNISISGIRSFPEGNSGTTNAPFTVTLDAASGRTVSVNWATADNTAAAGADYVAASGVLTFAPGTTTQTINVAVNGDLSDEPNESFVVDLSNPVNVTISDSQASVTIADDDDAPLVNIADVTVTEGNSGTSNAVFTVSLSAASGRTVTVNYASANGTATAPGDYTATSRTLTFAPNTPSLTINIPVAGDLLDEVNETFVVDLTQPSNATLGDAQATGTITDNDSPPAFSIADVAVTEPNSGTIAATFTVTMTGQSASAVTVDWASSNGTAAAPADYTSANGQLSFGPGVSTQTLTVLVAGDTLDETNETFTVTLSNPSGGATLTDASAAGTINDNDAPPSVSVADVTVTETNAGSAAAAFVVTLSAASGQTITVQWASADSTATAPADYAPGSGTLTFAAGTTQQTVNINVAGDTLDEANETFSVNLSNPANATLGDGTAVGTITDNDAAPSITIADVSIAEGNAGSSNVTLTLVLSAASGRTITVAMATGNGTATSGSDYTARTDTLTVAAGVTSLPFTVSVLGDTSDELDETFLVNLTSPTNATIGDGQATVTITDDDAAPSLSVADVTVTEANAGNNTATFTLTLSAATSRAVTVDYTTADGTALAGSDYDALSGTANFAAGVTTQTVIVTVRGDTIDETNESYTLNLSSPANATLADAQATGTITDNDAPPSVSIADVSASEGTGSLTFAAVLSAPSGRTITVSYATADGSAVSTADYVAANGVLTFLPGATTASLEVLVFSDALDEETETFAVNLSGANNVTIADGAANGEIVDDDDAPSISIASGTVVEGNAGSSAGTLEVTLSAPSSFEISVAYTTADGTAAAPADYLAASGVLTFPAGETARSIELTVNGDLVSEPSETVNVRLSSPVNASLAAAEAVLSITNDDQAPNLVLTATVGPDYLVGAEGEVVYTVENIGGGPTLGAITLSNQLPLGLQFSSAEGDGWTCAEDQGAVECENTAVLEPNDALSPLRLLLAIGPNAYPSVTHTATVSTSGDFDLADNSVELTTAVNGLADLEVTMSGPDAGALPGQEISWSIRVTNLGPNTLSEIFLVDELPSAVSNPIFAPSEGDYDENSGLYSNISLEAGASVELTVSAMLSLDASGMIENRATVSVTDVLVDPNGENDQAVHVFSVLDAGACDDDGLSDEREEMLGTDPCVADTDGDGLNDDIEVDGRNPTDPLDPDTDGDALCDGDQSVTGACVAGEDLNTNGIFDQGETDPNNPDTDSGGINDGEELERGTDPTVTRDDQDEGCDCRLSGRSGSGSPWFAALMLLGALLITRSRRK